MLRKLKNELGELDEIKFALQLMKADSLSPEEGVNLENNIIGLLTYLLTLKTTLSSEESDFKKKLTMSTDDNGKKYPTNRIVIEWDATDSGKSSEKVKNQIRIVEEELKSVRNFNYYLRSEKKI